jgi:NADH-quinone oxidoreductase subunit E
MEYCEFGVDLEEHLSGILREFDSRPEELIPMLQRTQRALGYLPEGALLEIARLTRLPAARVYGVATFYAQFRLQPVGKYIIKVCRGTACHVSGSDVILEDIQNSLQVVSGCTTEDRLFTLETVACFGCCALAPVVVVNGSVYGLMTPSKTRELLDGFRHSDAPVGDALETEIGKEGCNGLCNHTS